MRRWLAAALFGAHLIAQQLDDPVARLNARLERGETQLKFDGRPGYLRSVLDALGIPVESQLLTFGKLSLQAAIISPKNPRAIYFGDAVSAALVPGEPFIEIAAQDPRRGINFYTIDQRPVENPRFVRKGNCGICHDSFQTLGAPGMLIRSVPATADGVSRFHLGNYITDHRTPMEERWAGWFVTGAAGKNLGNVVIADLEKPDVTAPIEIPPNEGQRLRDTSDVAALMVFDHQMRMMNLIARAHREARAGAMPEESVREFVDYLLFVDEAPLAGPVRGASGFAEKFAAQGPRDRQGRSLRQLDFERRLLRYPCSYMIYSEAFDALPDAARAAIATRMLQVLSGPRFTPADRKAILEILNDTKPELLANQSRP